MQWAARVGFLNPKRIGRLQTAGIRSSYQVSHEGYRRGLVTLKKRFMSGRFNG